MDEGGTCFFFFLFLLRATLSCVVVTKLWPALRIDFYLAIVISIISNTMYDPVCPNYCFLYNIDNVFSFFFKNLSANV